jgi:hypothetical protein
MSERSWRLPDICPDPVELPLVGLAHLVLELQVLQLASAAAALLV